jgi:hypothetical protein
MNKQDTIAAVHNSMYHQIQNNGYATAVQVLIDLQLLSKEDYEKWRFGRIDYLERVCKINLSKLSLVLHTMRGYGRMQGLNESVTYYKKWGNKGKNTVKLRFSKYGNEYVEKSYATHFVKSKQAISISNDTTD